MKRGMTLFLAGVFVTALCVAAQAASRRPPGGLVYYHFDGQGFIAGKPAGESLCIAVGSRLMPVIQSGASKIEATALPSDKGAIAGICYIQNSGGKLAGVSGYSPCRRMPLRITGSEENTTTVMTDENGYFVALLEAGVYHIGDAPLAVEVRVEEGQTTLVPLRAGKRMVD